MAGFEYAPGDTLALIGPSVALLADIDPAGDLAADIFTAIGSDDATVDAVLELLVRPGLRAVENFAIMAQGDDSDCRVVLRGDFTARRDGAPDLTGRGLWADHSLPCPEVTIVAVYGAPTWLPATHAAVLASACRLRIAGRGEPPAVTTLRSLLSVPEPEDKPPAVEPVAPQAFESVPDEQQPEALIDEPQLDEPQLEPAHETMPPPHTGVLPQPTSPGFITAFPWADSPSGAPAQESPQTPQQQQAPQAPAPQPPAPLVIPPQPHPGPPPADAPGDRTVGRANLRVPGGGQAGPVVMSTRCPRGHFNSVHASRCRVCGAPVPPQQPVAVPRPPLGVLRLSNGGTVLLDRAAIMGRNPRVPGGYKGEQPNLVQLPDPERDISSQHLEVRPDDWHVTVKDLGSTNGTQVHLPGAPPITLRANDPMTIEPGTKVVIAGVFSFVFEAGG